MDNDWQVILASKGYDEEEGLGLGAYLAIGIIVLLVSSTALFGIIKKRKNSI